MDKLLDKSIQQAAGVFDKRTLIFTECNLKLARLFGYATKEEWLKIPIISFFSEKQIDNKTPNQTLKRIFKHFESNNIFFTSLVGLKKDRSKVLVELFAINNFFEDNNHIAFFFKEVDSYYLASKIVLDQNLVYQTLIKSSFDLIDVLEVKVHDRKNYIYEGFVIDRNENMKKIMGIKDEPMIFLEEIAELTPEKFYNENKSIYKKIVTDISQKGETSFQWEFVNSDKSVSVYNIGVYSIQLNNSVIVIRMMRDITLDINASKKIEKDKKSISKKENINKLKQLSTKIKNQLKSKISNEELTLFNELEAEIDNLTKV